MMRRLLKIAGYLALAFVALVGLLIAAENGMDWKLGVIVGVIGYLISENLDVKRQLRALQIEVQHLRTLR